MHNGRIWGYDEVMSEMQTILRPKSGRYAISVIFGDGIIAEAIRFSAVGVLNTVLTLFLIWLLYSVFGFGYYVANGVGYLVGFVNSFLWNKHWTFKSQGKVWRESLLFTLIFLLSYAIQVLVLWLFMDVSGCSILVSQGISMCAYTCVNFMGNRYVTFGKGMEHA